MGDDGIGVAVSQVVPMPNNAVVPLVRDFQTAWKAQQTDIEPSHLALEGFINARVFVGFHFRTSGEVGFKLGTDVAHWALHHYFEED